MPLVKCLLSTPFRPLKTTRVISKKYDATPLTWCLLPLPRVAHPPTPNLNARSHRPTTGGRAREIEPSLREAIVHGVRDLSGNSASACRIASRFLPKRRGVYRPSRRRLDRLLFQQMVHTAALLVRP